MAKKFIETGHAKNVDSLTLMNSKISTFGSKYNPSNTAISLAELQKLETVSRKAVNDVVLADASLGHATAARDLVFAKVQPTATSVLNMLRASTSLESIDIKAAAVVRKIRGSRAKSIKEEPPVPTKVAEGVAVAEKPKKISVSQQSFDRQVDNFDELSTLVGTVPEYKPNEDSLKIEALKAFATELRAKNDACKASVSVLEAARIERNRVLYAPDTGLVDVVLAAKSYVKAIYGAASPEYKMIASIAFHRSTI